MCTGQTMPSTLRPASAFLEAHAARRRLREHERGSFSKPANGRRRRRCRLHVSRRRCNASGRRLAMCWARGRRKSRRHIRCRRMPRAMALGVANARASSNKRPTYRKLSTNSSGATLLRDEGDHSHGNLFTFPGNHTRIPASADARLASLAPGGCSPALLHSCAPAQSGWTPFPHCRCFSSASVRITHFAVIRVYTYPGLLPCCCPRTP
jgi:hypothetical protein